MPLRKNPVCNFLSPAHCPAPCDLIFVLAGRWERKPYGLALFQQLLAPRLILSVGRFEVRLTAEQLGNVPGLPVLRDRLPPAKRHFWLDFKDAMPAILPANLEKPGTFWELQAVAGYLQLDPCPPSSIAVVTTSIHLRRVQLCCRRIPFFRDKDIFLLPVPEKESSFQRDGWWKRADHWKYMISELVKLAGYSALY